MLKQARGGLSLESVSKYKKEKYSKYNKSRKRSLKVAVAQRGVDLSYFQQGMHNNQVPYHERQFEDSHLTQYLHEQLLNIKLHLNLAAMASIMLSVTKSVFAYPPAAKTLALALQSVLTVWMVVLVVLKHYKGQELQIKQLVRVNRSRSILYCLQETWLELLYLIVHPNHACEGTIMMVPDPSSSQSVPLPLNSVLQIVMLGRIYLLFVSIISASIYLSPRASRLCRIYNSKRPVSFAAKSFFHGHPLPSLLLLFLSFALILAQMMMLAEQSSSVIETLEESLWCVIITMATVGYGDYHPVTYLGRVVAFIAAILGIIISSLLILTLSRYLAMQSREAKAHITLKRLQLREMLEQSAEETLLATAQLGTPLGDPKELEKQAEKTKLTLRRLKNMVDGDNLNEEIGGLFQTLYGNLLQIYLQQQEYSSALVRLKEAQGDRINELGFSFAKEIQQVIRQ